MSTSTYRAAIVRTPGGPDSIEIIDVPVAEPGPGKVRVEIAAASVNPVDLAVVRGVFHEMGLIDQPDHVGLGWDFAGTIVATGPGVRLAPGTRVAGMVAGFDRDYGTYAEQIIVSAADIAIVPDDLDLTTAATVPLNGLAAAQIVDLLGDAPADADGLLVTGAAGAVGGYVAVLAQDRGWKVTGLERPDDEAFVRSLGATFTASPSSGWDAVVDAAAMGQEGLALVGHGGTYVGVQPAAVPESERDITVKVVITRPDGARLTDLLARAAAGQLPARIHSVVPLDRVAEVHRKAASRGTRGRYVLMTERRAG